MSQPADTPRRVLIVGTVTIDEAVARARGIPEDGLLICIEGDRRIAATLTEAFAREGVSARAHVMTGDPALFIRKVAGPFDLIVLGGDETTAARLAGHVERRLAAGGRVVRGGAAPLG